MAESQATPKESIDVNQFLNDQFNRFFSIMNEDVRRLSKRTLNVNKQKAYGDVINLIGKYRKDVNASYKSLKEKNNPSGDKAK